MASLSLLQELQFRGIIHSLAGQELEKKLEGPSLTFYVGFDPTATSLQLGNLFPIITAKRLAQKGHRPIFLIGGATGMIGDPSGKSEERNLQSLAILQQNQSSQRQQLEHLMKNIPVIFTNNIEWFQNFSFIDFLREVGKVFRVNEMLQKDSVKLRLESEQGISFTEFSYSLLQAYDFYYLYKNHNATLQLGGSDQWGNIISGIDYTRRMTGQEVYGITLPLLTDSQGRKLGKTAEGALYVEKNLTSSYQWYQFFLNLPDELILKLLFSLSMKPLAELEEVKIKHQEIPEQRLAQKALGQEILEWIHGAQGVKNALLATDFFFGKEIDLHSHNLTDEQIQDIFPHIPSANLSFSLLEQGISVDSLLAQTPLFSSKADVRRLIEQGGVFLNNQKIDSSETKITSSFLLTKSTMLIRKGKKNYCVCWFS